MFKTFTIVNILSKEKRIGKKQTNSHKLLLIAENYYPINHRVSNGKIS
jgi:hypothetical protein